MSQQLPNFDVTIAGELNMDLILYGLPQDLPPERELLASDMMLTLGSSSAIVAHNLASLGNRVGFVSCIGGDHFGDIALGRLKEAGVDVTKVIKRREAKTGLTVILPRAEWRNIITYPGTIFDLRVSDLDLDYLCSARHFHLSSFYLQKGLRPGIPELLKKIKSAGLTVSLDCNDDPDDLWESDLIEALRYVDVFLPNVRELLKVTREDRLEAALDRISAVVPIVAVKLGSKGALARRGKEQYSSSALKINVLDPVGAGDSFDAGFLHEFIRGADLESCLRSGNLAGAFSTTRPGGTEAFRDQSHRENFYREHGKVPQS